MATHELSGETFEKSVDRDGIVLVDFWAPWCGPCRAFAPVYEKASEANPDALFAKVNTEEHPDLGATFEIRAIPTLMVFRDRVLVFARPGALPAAALDELIKAVRGLDMDDVRKQIEEEEKKAGEHGHDHDHDGHDHDGHDHDH